MKNRADAAEYTGLFALYFAHLMVAASPQGLEASTNKILVVTRAALQAVRIETHRNVHRTPTQYIPPVPRRNRTEASFTDRGC